MSRQTVGMDELVEHWNGSPTRSSARGAASDPRTARMKGGAPMIDTGPGDVGPFGRWPDADEQWEHPIGDGQEQPTENRR
ncbi:hypothetical protein [Streptomyces sp. NBC_00893]|uniref:hypothetical protein n=1 Tax=Streptomyces sp. NBC_00893 TaxID=2975862 RepID=UPI0022585B45|nr:hypothetical protein [Streptomyces sp. NBC_00893]MCX4852130.1 hypothetical protein [Streptomyces sp. NBC_00893]